jgi:hypothetical protein
MESEVGWLAVRRFGEGKLRVDDPNKPGKSYSGLPIMSEIRLQAGSPTLY